MDSSYLNDLLESILNASQTGHTNRKEQVAALIKLAELDIVSVVTKLLENLLDEKEKRVIEVLPHVSLYFDQ